MKMAYKKTIHLIVSPTNRKKHKARPNLADLKSTRSKKRFSDWTSILDEYEGDRVRALDLYAGDHWVITKNLASDFPNFNIQIWVISPGYGLINVESKIVPYAATFSPDHTESVHYNKKTNLNEANRQWWNYLRKWQPKNIEGPRSISDLSDNHPNDSLIIACSMRYLNLLRDDLETLTKKKNFDQTKLYLVSSQGRKSLGALAENLVPSERKLRQLVGGGDASLNIRTAKLVLKMLAEGKTNNTQVRTAIQLLLDGIPAIQHNPRKSASVDKVTSFIKFAISINPNLTKTACLTLFRRDGYACQAKRFERLFEENSQ